MIVFVEFLFLENFHFIRGIWFPGILCLSRMIDYLHKISPANFYSNGFVYVGFSRINCVFLNQNLWAFYAHQIEYEQNWYNFFRIL